jgi:hypothetical protein
MAGSTTGCARHMKMMNVLRFFELLLPITYLYFTNVHDLQQKNPEIYIKTRNTVSFLQRGKKYYPLGPYDPPVGRMRGKEKNVSVPRAKKRKTCIVVNVLNMIM